MRLPPVPFKFLLIAKKKELALAYGVKKLIFGECLPKNET